MRYGNYKILWSHDVKKGKTGCGIFTLDGNPVTQAVIKKYAHTEYNKEEARKYSLQRALEQTKMIPGGHIDKAERTAIWKDYFSRHGASKNLVVTFEQDGKRVEFKMVQNASNPDAVDATVLGLNGLKKYNELPLLFSLFVQKFGTDLGLFNPQQQYADVQQPEGSPAV